MSGRMGENQGGLRTGWLAAFGTEGYEGEPPLMEELGVNFRHIKGKVCMLSLFLPSPPPPPPPFILVGHEFPITKRSSPFYFFSIREYLSSKPALGYP